MIRIFIHFEFFFHRTRTEKAEKVPHVETELTFTEYINMRSYFRSFIKNSTPIFLLA